MKAFPLLFWLLLAPLVASATEDRATEFPSPVLDVVYVRAFTLSEGYQHDWSAERPYVTSGTLAVFSVNPELVVPRNAAEPVLYAGDQTAQRLNSGHESGHVIAIIPGEIDLAEAPVWFGSPGLPERASSESIRAERAAADHAKIEAFGAEKLRNLTRSPVSAENLPELLREHVADLVLAYSPQERELADRWRLPVARR